MVGVIDDTETWKKMAQVSPITHIKKVKTPTLLLLGKKDLRVPSSQGLSYYNMLKELKVPTK
jgi:acylaminoacyl-peptidase